MCVNFVGMVLLAWMPMFLYASFISALAMAGLTATIYVATGQHGGFPLARLVGPTRSADEHQWEDDCPSDRSLWWSSLCDLVRTAPSVLGVTVALTAWGSSGYV